MQRRLSELQLQRGRLLERIAHQRQLLAGQVRPISHTLQFGDRLADAVSQCRQFVRQHPLAVAAAVIAVAVLRPAGAWRWARRGFLAWRSWTTLRGSLPALLSRFL